jgi:cytochrome c553
MSNRLVLMILMLSLLLAVFGALAAGDPVRGAEVAEECAFCHGDEGLGDGEFPAIAGMEEAALLKELEDFKSGARPDEIGDMTDVLEFLSEKDMEDAAAYYSRLPGPDEDG